MITFDTEQATQAVQSLSPDRLEILRKNTLEELIQRQASLKAGLPAIALLAEHNPNGDVASALLGFCIEQQALPLLIREKEREEAKKSLKREWTPLWPTDPNWLDDMM